MVKATTKDARIGVFTSFAIALKNPRYFLFWFLSHLLVSVRLDARHFTECGFELPI